MTMTTLWKRYPPLKMLTPLLLGAIGWIWALFVAQYKYQILETDNSASQFLFLNMFLTLLCTTLLVRIFLKNESKDRSLSIIGKSLRAFVGFIIFGIMNYVAIMGFLLTINALFDWGTKRTYGEKVIEANIEGKGRSTRYYVMIAAAWTDTKENYKVYLSRYDYLDLGLTPDSHVAITVGNGALGFLWVESIREIRQDRVK